MRIITDCRAIMLLCYIFDEHKPYRKALQKLNLITPGMCDGHLNAYIMAEQGLGLASRESGISYW